MKGQLSRALLASAVAALAVAGTASGAVTASQITAPAGPTFVYFDFDIASPPPALTVTGTTTGGASDPVNLRCYYGPGSGDYETVASSVTVANNAFSRDVAGSALPDRPCRLRAVPVGDVDSHPADSTSDPFSGPLLAPTAKSTNVYSGLATDYLVSASTFGGYFAFEGVGDCGIEDSWLFRPGNLSESNELFYCAAALYGVNSDASVPGSRSEVQINGQDAYGPTAAQYVAESLSSFPMTGQPQITVTTTQDPGTGAVTITETDPYVACSPGGAYPATHTSCTSFVPTGVSLTRTWTTQSDDHRAVDIDSWRATDGNSHPVSLLYDEQLASIANPPTVTRTSAFRFPGETAFSPRAHGTQIALPAGTGSIYYKADSATPDTGDDVSPQGAITYSSAPDGPVLFTWSDVGSSGDYPEFELPYSRTIPATGSLTLGFAYSQAFTLGEAQTLAQQAEAAFSPPPPPPPPPAPPTPAPKGVLSVVGKPKVSRGKVVLELRCTGNLACGARVRLTAKSGKHSSTVGSASRSVAAGKAVTIKLGLNAKGRKLLRHAKHRRLAVRLVVSQRTGTTTSTIKTARLTVKKT